MCTKTLVEENEDLVMFFFISCLGLTFENALYRLRKILDHCAQETMQDNGQMLKHGQVHYESIGNLPCEKEVRNVVHKKHTNKEFMFNGAIGNFDMNNVILDPGLM